jgi:hypothetical protein
MAREVKLPALVQLRLPDDTLVAIDDWRRAQPDIPTRSEAMRRLMTVALQAGSTGEPQPTFRELLERFYAEDPARIEEAGIPAGTSPADAARLHIDERMKTAMLYRFEQLLEELTIGEYSGQAVDALRARLKLIVDPAPGASECP